MQSTTSETLADRKQISSPVQDPDISFIGQNLCITSVREDFVAVQQVTMRCALGTLVINDDPGNFR